MEIRTDASSIETGSSARMNSGSSISARAMATRWRCPPLSICGYLFAKNSGGLSFTLFKALSTAASRSERFPTL